MKTEECGAKARSTSLPCKKPVERGRSRCRIHGGATPRGIASPHFVHGKYSQDLPPQLLLRYLEARDDPELLSLRDDVAVLEALIKEKFAQIRDGETGPDWTAVLNQFEDLVDNFQTWDWTKQEQALRELGALLTDRRNEAVVLDEILGLMDQKARLAMAEHKRLVRLQQTMTVEQALTLASILADIVRRNVKDPEALRIIQAEWTEVTNAPPVRSSPR